jgi:formylglycine-generating enzyme required for sulfatase activity
MFRAFILLLALALTGAGFRASAADQVAVPAGAFTMGRDDGPADERPAHSVTLPDFRIDRLPVTNRRFAGFLNAAGPLTARGEHRYDSDDADARIHRVNGVWQADAGYAEHPVVEVSWAGARDFCQWSGARLPTEAEWEKAARGSDGHYFPWGNTFDPNRLNSADRGPFDTTPVGRFATGASSYGMLDAAGQVFEWTASTDGNGNAVVKGGSWDDKGCGVCRLAARHGRPPSLKHILIGFRLVRD